MFLARVFHADGTRIRRYVMTAFLDSSRQHSVQNIGSPRTKSDGHAVYPRPRAVKLSGAPLRRLLWSTAVCAASLASAIALLAWPRATSASCENMIQAQSRELWFIYNDVYPERASEGDMRSMWDAMAHGLATAAACQRRINADTRLTAILRRSPIHLAMTPGEPVRRASDLDHGQPSASDSLFAIFDGLAVDSAALLFTVRIGAASDSSLARDLFARFGWLDDMRDDCAPLDSTLVLDWTHESCSIGDCERPTLFMLPPAVSRTGRWTVLSGLFVGRRDANNWLGRIRRRGGSKAEVVSIRVTGAVLSNALPSP